VAPVFADDRQAVVDLRDQRLALARRVLDTELAREAREHPGRVGGAVEHDQHAGLEDLLLEVVEELAHDHRLACTDVADQDAQTLRLPHRAIEAQQRLLLLARLEQELLGRLVAEGVFLQLEVMEMFHVGSSNE